MMPPNAMRHMGSLLLSLAMLAASTLVSAQEKVHGANSVFVASTVKIGWAVQKGTSEESTVVVLRVINSVGQYSQVRLDGVDPFSNNRKVLVSARPLGDSIDLSVPRSGFVEFPSCEIQLYRSEAPAAEKAPTLTVYYLGVPDTTPEFVSARDAEAYLAKALGQ
jgi:hypothetical protein